MQIRTKIQSRRLTAAAGLILVLATACSQGSSSSTQSDTLKVALDTFGTGHFDPLKLDNFSKYLPLMFDSLVGQNNQTLQFSKDTGLATDWSNSPDFKTFTFTLRQGVKFSNGDPVTADDVKFSLDRLKGPDKPVSPDGSIVGSALDTVTVLSPTQVQVTLKKSFPLFLYHISSLSAGGGQIVPMKYIQQVGNAGFDLQPIGSGPYKLQSFKPGAYVNLVLSGYPHFGITPKFKYVFFNLVPDEATRVALLQRHQVDFIDAAVDDVGTLKSAGVKLWQAGAADNLQFWFELQKPNQVFDDSNLRQALSLAINRAEIAKTILGGYGKVSTTPMPGQLGADIASPYTYDPTMAKQLLAQSGYGPGGKTLSIQFQVTQRAGWPQMVTIAEAMISYWTAIGVKSVMTYRDYGAFRADWQAGSFPQPAVLLLSEPGGRTDWSGLLNAVFTCKGAISSYCDSAFDQEVAQWQSATSQDQYLSLSKDLESKIRTNFLDIGIVDLGIFYAGDSNIPASYQEGRASITFNERVLVGQSPTL